MGLNFFLIESDLIRAGLPVQELARLYLFSIVTIILICRCFITLFFNKNWCNFNGINHNVNGKSNNKYGYDMGSGSM